MEKARVRSPAALAWEAVLAQRGTFGVSFSSTAGGFFARPARLEVYSLVPAVSVSATLNFRRSAVQNTEPPILLIL